MTQYPGGVYSYRYTNTQLTQPQTITPVPQGMYNQCCTNTQLTASNHNHHDTISQGVYNHRYTDTQVTRPQPITTMTQYPRACTITATLTHKSLGLKP
ncbi:hypothetical protein PoB_003906100 [Plakobranchus ocellatus]|uniref:Uncharacterized protein n=1 Tax=Plakobranchus ocellatus TaxID=259542 RepID=A0AAV4B146_9GAST|nr:hypothetical protein PoB_003906100 [Plakobranchus ocellatus]